MSSRIGKFELAAFDRSLCHCQRKPTGKSSTFPVPVGIAIHVGSSRVKNRHWFKKLNSQYGSGTSSDVAALNTPIGKGVSCDSQSFSSWQSNQARLLILLPRHPEFHIWAAGPTLDPACLDRPPKHPALSAGFDPIDSGSWPFWKLRSLLLQNTVQNRVRRLIFPAFKYFVVPDPIAFEFILNRCDILVGSLCNYLPLATARTPHPRV